MKMNPKKRLPDCCVLMAVPREDFTLLVTFATGEQKIVDVKQFEYMREILNDVNLFMQAEVKYGGVIWTDCLGIGPETLYKLGVPCETKTDDWKRLVDELVAKRKEKKLSQYDLGNLLNVTQSVIARIESKANPPKINTLLKLGNALGYTLKWEKLDN